MEKIKNLGTTIKEKLNVLMERVKTDKKFCVILIAIVVAVIAAIIALVLVLGGGGAGGGLGLGHGSGNNTDDGTKVAYTVSVKSKGGLPLGEVDVAIYDAEDTNNLKDYAKTDENGLVNFQLGEDGNYIIVLTGVPKGYAVEESYTFDGTTAVISLTSSVIKDDNLTSAVLNEGDVMYDFTITTADGGSYTLSEILKEKKMVLINYWYTTCSWCVKEFPVMAEAYEQYKDEIEIIAVNPMGEGEAAVKNFAESMQLPFPVVEVPSGWANVFSVTGYPTSVLIDQYGVVCLIERGAITSLSPFVSAFEHFTADDYQQKLCNGTIKSLYQQIKPNVSMPSSDEIASVINKGDIEVTYRPEEGDSAEYTWPFVIGDKNGTQCIYAPNIGIEDSYAILYADVTLKKGQALKLEYLSSTEKGNDIMYVIVNDEPIFNISGWEAEEKWQSCYPCIADEDGVYEVALCYIKDSDTNEGDDTVYIKGMSVVNESQIDTETYIPRLAAKETEDGSYTYVDIVYNEADGYYHVGSKNGPLLLADLMNYSQFNEEKTIYELIYDNGEFEVNGKNVYDDFIQYCNYASNAKITGVCTVNKELAEFLKEAASLYGFEDDDNEWLKMCKYYAAYGSNGHQLEDPIKGLATFSAYKATLGKGVPTNYFYYDRAIIPRGLMAEFIPSVSGVYRITSHNESQDGVDAWIFNANREEILTYERDERLVANYADDNDVSMVYYMEAGTPYYIDIAFWDVYEVGTITYDIEYLGASADIFRLASPGYFTYDSDATGDAMYYVIAGGIDVVLNPADGIYYEDLGKDANGKQKYGSKLYADFTGLTPIFNSPIATNSGVKGMIDMGGFDFSKTENDLFVLSYLEKNNFDEEATLAALKEYWGEDSYEGYYDEYEVEDVFEGKYHGKGKDMTEDIRKYVSQIDTSGTEKNGCVVVTEELAEILQLIMDKYTFEDVDHSWTKLCYYYDHLGPEN